MPQDAQNIVPVEASETLAFTPSRFAELHDKGKLDTKPEFILRACTERDKRFRENLIVEVGAMRHSLQEVRAETLRGLEVLWGSEQFEQNRGKLEAYWQAREDFDLQKKDDPKLVWSYDPVIEAAVTDLNRDLTKEWRPLGKMIARNAYASQMAFETMVAVTVKTFSGLDIEPVIDRRYLDIDSIGQIETALTKLEEKHGLKPGLSWAELLGKCATRMFLDEEEAKNCASPSPSESPQQNSKTGANPDGTSTARATSKKTRASD
ncbi:hypothetical protein SZ64_04390 [Erythrobacter sp. SG61-1L]|uniref:hypothetical protein n=1 Tax=Erythrobacter sp. SG61-1L TaxID=1603897 RepID=UPI0006C8F94D|nr:hypothetical protein [Erythrobacter sp. SG61-1L]KPL67409.1 hypothetical protein SZ64_04390 [Erythrobacter sp. SG61-1L]